MYLISHLTNDIYGEKLHKQSIIEYLTKFLLLLLNRGGPISTMTISISIYLTGYFTECSQPGKVARPLVSIRRTLTKCRLIHVSHLVFYSWNNWWTLQWHYMLVHIIPHIDHFLRTRNSPGDEIPERDWVPKYGVGVTVPPMTTTAARFYMLFYLLLLIDDVYITSILNAHFLAQKNSERKQAYRN